MPRASKQEDRVPDAKGSPDQSHKTRRRKVLPSADSVIAETTFISPRGHVYRILRTNQTDPYDPLPGKPEVKASNQPKRGSTQQKRRRRQKA